MQNHWKQIILNLIAVFGVLLFLGSCTQSKETWEFLAENQDNQDKLYYSRNISRNSGVLKIKTKIVAGEQTKQRLVQAAAEKEPLLRQKYENFSYSVHIDEIDCRERKQRLSSFADYDSKGNLILQSRENVSDWQDIPPKTFNELIFNVACKEKSSGK